MVERRDSVRMRHTVLNEELEGLASAVIGAAIEVHRLLGPGFVEAVYEEALCLELSIRNIPFARQPAIKIEYKGHKVGDGRLDVLVGNELIVELKAVDMLAPVHTSQLLSYLRATDRRLGLLINFNVKLLKDGIVRLVL
jgi:GxxExxY protein